MARPYEDDLRRKFLSAYDQGEETLEELADQNNQLEPGGIDQGQPTLFAPRREKWVFLLKEPSDFGNKQVVWTLKAHGRTETATGKLIPALQITERLIMSKGSLSPGVDDPHKPPTISVAPPEKANVSGPVYLTARVTSDWLSKRTMPTVDVGHVAPVGSAQTNGVARPARFTVSWLEYSGPAGVTFDEKAPPARIGPGDVGVAPESLVEDGKATATVHFSQPGTYVLIAKADDSHLTASQRVTVNVSK